MGREIILKRFKREGILEGVIGTLTAMAAICLIVVMIVNGASWIVGVVMAAPFGIIAVALLVRAWLYLSRPEKSKEMRNNPELLLMADALYSDIIYEDKSVRVSNRVLASVKNPLQMTWLEDVYWVYKHTETINLIPVTIEFVLETRLRKNTLRFNIMAKRRTNEKLLEIISQMCPNAVFGYTDEARMYTEQMRQANARTTVI